MPPTNYDAGRMALQKLESHERVCSERYEQIKSNQAEAKTERREMHEKNQEAIAGIAGRVDRLYNRAWTVALAIISTEFAIIVGVVGFVMKKVMSP